MVGALMLFSLVSHTLIEGTGISALAHQACQCIQIIDVCTTTPGLVTGVYKSLRYTDTPAAKMARKNKIEF